MRLQKKLGTDRAIGEEFGITPQAVFYIRKGYGIPPLPGVRASVAPRISKAELITLQKTLKTDKAIGAKFSITPQAVYYIRKKYGIPSRLPDNTKRNAKIVALYKRGMTKNAIAGAIGGTASLVYRLLKRPAPERKNRKGNHPRRKNGALDCSIPMI